MCEINNSLLENTINFSKEEEKILKFHKEN